MLIFVIVLLRGQTSGINQQRKTQCIRWEAVEGNRIVPSTSHVPPISRWKYARACGKRSEIPAEVKRWAGETAGVNCKVCALQVHRSPRRVQAPSGSSNSEKALWLSPQQQHEAEYSACSSCCVGFGAVQEAQSGGQGQANRLSTGVPPSKIAIKSAIRFVCFKIIV